MFYRIVKPWTNEVIADAPTLPQARAKIDTMTPLYVRAPMIGPEKMPKLTKKDIEGMKKLSKKDAKEILGMLEDLREGATLTTYIDPELEEFKREIAKAEKVLDEVLKSKVVDEKPKLPSVRKERLVKIAKLLRQSRDKGLAVMERIEGELSPLLVGIKPQNMATQSFLYDPKGEKQRQKLAWLFMEKGMLVPLALVDYLNTDFVARNIPPSKIGGSGRHVPPGTRARPRKK